MTTAFLPRHFYHGIFTTAFATEEPPSFDSPWICLFLWCFRHICSFLFATAVLPLIHRDSTISDTSQLIPGKALKIVIRTPR